LAGLADHPSTYARLLAIPALAVVASSSTDPPAAAGAAAAAAAAAAVDRLTAAAASDASAAVRRSAAATVARVAPDAVVASFLVGLRRPPTRRALVKHLRLRRRRALVTAWVDRVGLVAEPGVGTGGGAAATDAAGAAAAAADGAGGGGGGGGAAADAGKSGAPAPLPATVWEALNGTADGCRRLLRDGTVRWTSLLLYREAVWHSDVVADGMVERTGGADAYRATPPPSPPPPAAAAAAASPPASDDGGGSGAAPAASDDGQTDAGQADNAPE